MCRPSPHRQVIPNTKSAPDEVEMCTVKFEKGYPVEINGEAVTPLQAIMTANRIGGRNGIGIGIHAVENRFVGIKSRGVYESPGMSLLGQTYEYLLQLILDRRARRVFNQISEAIGEPVFSWSSTGLPSPSSSIG